MALNKYRLGDLISICDERNSEGKYILSDVKGISTQKIFIETKADMLDVSLKNYKIVKSHEFAYVADTSRRGDKISLAYNNTDERYLVSSISTVFKVCRTDLLNSDYLYMYFNRPEFDRYSRFSSWGSARETFSWDDICNVEIELPSIEVQKKYVNIYNAMLENQKCYERGLEDLKISCIASIEKLKKSIVSESIIPYIKERKEINSKLEYDELFGVGNGGFILPRGAREKSTFHKCNIFYPNDFVYNPSVVSKGAIAFNSRFKTPKICTEEYIVFYVINKFKLSPEYLFLWLKRKETGRYLEFINMDSVRNRVYFKDLESIKIPIPNINIQNSIAKMFIAYNERKQINEKLKAQIKNICPILIKGSIEEATKTKEV